MSKKFKSLLEFLEGPVWNTPIMTFIEVKSAVFSEDENNESEYQLIFNDYKRLVDTMLGTYLEDMNITPEQFEEECKAATDSKLMTSFRQSLFEQVWAAENFEIFKRMMTQKNIELELQALSLLQYTLGIKGTEVAPEDDEILKRVLKQSAEEHEMHTKRLEKMDEDYQKTLKETLKEAERLDNEYQKSKSLMEKVIKMSIEENKKEPSKIIKATKSAPAKTKSEPTMKALDKRKSYPMVGATRSLEGKDNSNQNEATLQKSAVDENALKLRQKYLREQRDKLVNQKKLEREKHLNEFDTSKRPKSSKVARNFMADKMDASKSKLDPKTLQMRKALALCLKEELINQ